MDGIQLSNISDTGSLAMAALQMAQGQVGQCEHPKGSNSGPMVNEYLHAVGLAPGYAWCQAFVYWCYEAAAKKLSVANPLIRTAGVHDCWSRTASTTIVKKLTKADVLSNTVQPASGDQFILYFGKVEGHTGIVEKVDGTLIYTIEGNSNDNGSREGYEVVRHIRNLNDKALMGFIRYEAPTPSPTREQAA